MRALLSKLQLAGVFALPIAALFVEPKFFLDGTLPLAFAAWSLYLVGLAAGKRALPASLAGRVAAGGLVALAVLTAASIPDAVDRTGAAGNFNALLFYLGWALAAASAFGDGEASRHAEPLAWLTASIAAAWGLSERVAPRIIEFPQSRIAFGRLFEPIGYWNAAGALAGVGVVLAVGIAADSRTRGPLIRTAAAFTFPLLVCALWLSFSRGALAATAAGLAALFAVRPAWRTARATAAAVAIGTAVAVITESLAGTRTLTGPIGPRASDGLVLGLALLGLALVSAVAERLDSRLAGAPTRTAPGKTLQRVAAAAAVLLALLPAAIVVTGSRDSGSTPAATGADASRLQSLDSNRSKYWRVALDQFESEPISGTGSGSFRLEWERQRAGRSSAKNAHSLEIETLGELGLLGIASLVCLGGGVWIAGRRRRWSAPGSLAAASAGLAVFASHSSVDWDWQVPGLMAAVLLLGAAVAAAPRRGYDSREHSALTFGCAAIAMAALVWTGHIWEAKALEHDANQKASTAGVLGWTPERRSYVVSRLKQAAWLNPDPSPKVDLAIAYFDMGNPRKAAAEALELTRSQPGWWLGWSLVWNYRKGTDLLIAWDARKRAYQLRGMPMPAGRPPQR